MFPLEQADQCVKCGLCLPHCPTYTKTMDEADSPRGRIALMQGVFGGDLPLTADVEAHLDRCLTCRACEVVCPAEVPYGALIDAARAGVETRRRRPFAGRVCRAVALATMARPAGVAAVATALRMYQRSGLRWLACRVGLLRGLGLARLDGLLPPLARPWRGRGRGFPARAGGDMDVFLFPGCVAPELTPETPAAAVRMLNALGLNVVTPAGAVCCGAMHQHAGAPGRARALQAANEAAFAGAVPVAVTASACCAQLVGASGSAGMADRIRDINDLILAYWPPGDLTLQSLSARVAVHDPCTRRYHCGGQDAAARLLGLIPGLEVVPLAGNSQCCGAGGANVVTQPSMADDLLADKLDAIVASDADYVATSNIGCALHLGAGLRARGSPVEVLHPVTLIARQLAVPA